MSEYHKINSMFKRGRDKKFTEEYSCPEFEYLKDNLWMWDEKIDGTNIRIYFDGVTCKIAGRTDQAQIRVDLFNKLTEYANPELFKEVFPDIKVPVILYGEGFGAKIQDGHKYLSSGVDFILFDVKIGHTFLDGENMQDVASKLKIAVVPLAGIGTLDEAIECVKHGNQSNWGDFKAEGLVLRPLVPLFDSQGQRVITKVKHKDFTLKMECGQNGT